MKNQKRLLDLEGTDLDEAINRIIKENVNPRTWSAKEEDILRRLYGRVTNAALARELGRTYGSVRMKAVGLGLSKPYKRNNNHNG